MALDHFLPMLKKRERKGLRGAADRVLRLLGPTWRSAPARRAIQAVCFTLFLYLFFVASWPYADLSDGGGFAQLEGTPVELFLWLDPLVGLSTAVAARCWNVAMAGALGILLVGLFVPRGFCGYLCPLGTLVDLSDWAIVRRLRRRPVKPVLGERLKPIKYALLITVLVASCFGVLLSGFVAAIPVLTRGMLFGLSPWQLTWLKNSSMVRPMGVGEMVSLGLFLSIFAMSFLEKRFWCRYLCPSGAVFSVCNRARLTQRKVEDTCIGCGRCVQICPFDAIDPDFNTITADCTWCQTCGGVCPPKSIKFVSRWNSQAIMESEIDRPEPGTSRRGFIAAAISGATVALGIRQVSAGNTEAPLLRPPGSVSEEQFLQLCIRCGQCFQVCPGPVLHPASWDQGIDALWTPVALPSHAGCHQDCNLCTQVCPTGAIRPMSIEEKRKTSMGLAVINPETCLPHTGEQDCRLCVEECQAAGYDAIVVRTISLELTGIPEGMFSDMELERMSRIEAPFIDADRCVGCGLCEYRCHTALVKQQHLLSESAVLTVAENTDR